MISIALATYNGAKYIQEQLDSILNQTIQDFELIICDDCSTDDTWNIVERYSAEDNRIRIYRNDKNLGFRKNFEGIIPRCKGEFVAFCDQDDVWLPNHLEILLKNIEGRDASSANAEIINEDGSSKGFSLKDFTRLKYWPNNPLDQAYPYFYYRNPFPGCNTMFRTSFLNQVYPIHHDHIGLHDTFAEAMACVWGKGVGYSDDIITKYRFHQNSVTAKSKTRNSQRPYMSVLRRLLFGPGSKRYGYARGRQAYIEEIEYKQFVLNEKQKKFLAEVSAYHKRRRSVLGRIRNLFFDICHYRKIHNTWLM